jgi:hypothetical protein
MSKKLTYNDAQLLDLFKECLTEIDNKTLLKEGSDSNVESIKREIKEFIKSSNPDFEKEINKKVLEAIKGKDVEKYLVEINKNVLSQLYKSLWTKRAFWANDLKNVRA